MLHIKAKGHAQAVTMIIISFFTDVSNVIIALSVTHQLEYLFAKTLENEHNSTQIHIFGFSFCMDKTIGIGIGIGQRPIFSQTY